MVGRDEEGKSALLRLHGGVKRANMDVVDAEYAEISIELSVDVSSKPCANGQEVSSHYKIDHTHTKADRFLCCTVNVNAYFG